MLLKIAWRNLWRNSRRSIIILMSIIVGVAALLLSDSIMRGMAMQMLTNQIDSNIGHIQINKEGFNNNPVIQAYVPKVEEIENILNNKQFVKNYSKRVITSGMINSTATSSGITLMGINNEAEKNITNIHEYMLKGSYLKGNEREIIIGNKLADKLELDLDDKVVAVAASTDGSISNQLFRVAGIFKTGNSKFDKMYAYINIGEAQKMLGLDNHISEIVILTDNLNKTQEYTDILRNDLQHVGLEILPYQEIIPLLVSYFETFEASMLIFYVIIITAILFGIINTLLMSVFERIQEFGVLMSIGMKNGKIFFMVLQEAFLLGVIGTIVGFGVGLLALWPMMDGIDLSVYSESLSSFGTGSIIYPIFDINVMLNSLLIMPFASVLGAIYPAVKAMKFTPTEAMRYV